MNLMQTVNAKEGMSMSKDYPPYLDYPKQRKTQTNADKIRAMTDEEMAEFFPSTASEWACPPGATEANCKNVGGWFQGCPKCWLNWLKQEVE